MIVAERDPAVPEHPFVDSSGCGVPAASQPATQAVGGGKRVAVRLAAAEQPMGSTPPGPGGPLISRW